MTHQTMDRPLTVSGVLFADDDPASTKALERTLGRAGIYGTAYRAAGVLSTVARDEIRSHLTQAAKDLLGARVVDAVFAGWQKKNELVEAAEATASDPEKSVLVDLCSQRIETSDVCTLDLVVDGATIGSFRFVVTLALDIDAMLAIIRGGRLVGVRAGNCDVVASLAVNDQQLAERRRRIELNGLVSLGTGLPLCHAASLRVDLAGRPQSG